MKNENLKMLEFDVILEKLAEMTVCEGARTRAMALLPYETTEEVEQNTKQTASARRLLDACGAPPLSEIDGHILKDKLGKGMTLPPPELCGVARFLNTCRLLRRYMERAISIDALVAGYGMSIDPLDHVREEIERCVRGDYIDDRASAELNGIRRKKEQLSSKIKEKLSSMLRAHPEWYQDNYYSQRGERFGLPVKAGFRKMVPGTVIDASGSGATVFIEPAAVQSLREQLDILQIAEENEIFRILSSLTNLVEQNLRSVSINVEAMEHIDFCFAKAKLGASMAAVTAILSPRREISLEMARHPLIEYPVPLSIALGKTRAMVITGPNTGGKTVAIKTIGLLSIMALAGLQVPASSAVIPMFSHVLCDIGDGQSIQQSLSTFSAHVTRLVNVLRFANGKSLVLLDELGAGTDPAEGMGLAVSMLEELGRRGCILAATTHYPEIKTFARETSGFMNARMEFDKETLRPLYRLIQNEAGESCALHIAKRLGMPEHLLKRAWELVYPGKSNEAKGAYADEFSARQPSAMRQTLTIEQASSMGETSIADEPSFMQETIVAKQPSSVEGTLATKQPPLDREAPVEYEAPVQKASAATKEQSDDSGKKPSFPTPQKTAKPDGLQYRLGDSVYVTSLGRSGIVCQERNAKGEIGVRVLGQKVIVREQRLRMNIKREELYPGDDYDLDIVLDTVQNRKTKNALRKGKKGAVLVISDDNI